MKTHVRIRNIICLYTFYTKGTEQTIYSVPVFVDKIKPFRIDPLYNFLIS